MEETERGISIASFPEKKGKTTVIVPAGVGQAEIANALVRAKMRMEDIEILVVDDNKIHDFSQREIIEIGGERYERVRENPLKMSPIIPMMAMLSTPIIDSHATSGDNPVKAITGEKDPDIIEEYRLIQQKKSNLTKSKRDWVVRQFERMYKKI